ncbi:hypothetical protein LJC31_03395 [Synergistaceae bacterium OttesenSCG-928-I11]|nr:hypothetical protein [Synergistaceae bacterium OttesenSCG-928-I11]
MTKCEQEAMELFGRLSLENQNHLLMLTRLAYIAECSVKKSMHVPIDEALRHAVASEISGKQEEEENSGSD